jgi:hypothetical protein
VPAHSILAAACLIAAAVAAAINAADPFNHGVWLVAYLFLVGFVAQLLLGRGQAALLAGVGEPDRDSALRALLWSAGVVLVPTGVLIEARLLVVVGGLALLGALAIFLRTARSMQGLGGASRRLRTSQLALIAFMAGSVLVGTALAWDTPWV